jgi:cytochrome P450
VSAFRGEDRLLLMQDSLAGSDTTAISLRACFYYLIKNPKTYQNLVAEIDEADKRGQLSTYVTYEECLRLPYL